jgi:hypothetical protein
MPLPLVPLLLALACQGPQEPPAPQAPAPSAEALPSAAAADPAELWLWEHLRDVALLAGHDPRGVPPPERLLEALADGGAALTPAEVHERLKQRAPWMLVNTEEDYLRDLLTVQLLEAGTLPAWAPADRTLLADGRLPPSPFWPATANRAQRLLLLHLHDGDPAWLEQAAMALEQFLELRSGYTYGSYLLAWVRQLQGRPDDEDKVLAAAGQDARAGYERFFRRPPAELAPYLEMNLLEDCMVRRGIEPRLPDLGGAGTESPDTVWHCGDLEAAATRRPEDHRLFMRLGFLDDSAERLSASMIEAPDLAGPEAFLQALGLGPGMVVADIGAGLGFFTMPMARAVRPDGRVLALELDPLLVDYLGFRATLDGVDNIETFHNPAGDIALEAGSLDAALLSLTLGSLVELRQEPYAVEQRATASLLASIHQALGPEGALILIDDHSMLPRAQALALLGDAGFSRATQPLELWSPFYVVVAHKGGGGTPPSDSLCGFGRQAAAAEPAERCRQAGCDAAHTSGGQLDPIVTPPAGCQGEDLLEESWFDGVAHGFPFDLDQPEREAERVRAAAGEGRSTEVILRGIYLQVGMELAQDPAACQAFVTRDLGLPAWDRAFAMANGMAWSQHGTLPDKIERAEMLEGSLQAIYLEELGWQSRRPRVEAITAPAEALALVPAEHRCTFLHGRVRSLTDGRASEDEALALALDQPELCRLHVLHAAVRYRDDGDEGERRRALAPELPPSAWEALDGLP